MAALLVAAAVSGCSDAKLPASDAPVSHGMTIVGLVQNETFAPVAGAHVALRLTDQATVTDAGGLFSFHDLLLAPYLVDVVAEGYTNATLNAEPRDNVSLSFVLVRPGPLVPEPVVLHFQGSFQCALEAFIITPSCDTLLDEGNLSVFEDISTFDFGLNPQWSGVVVDVDFAEHPGLDGLRVTVQGRNDADQLNAYEQYGRFHGSDPFTFLLEPGREYPDGAKAMPENATALQLEVYPHGHGWHALCTPPAPDIQPCPLGVGFALSVQFDLYVTIFFVDPAPAGYSLLA